MYSIIHIVNYGNQINVFNYIHTHIYRQNYNSQTILAENREYHNPENIFQKLASFMKRVVF